MFQLCRNKVHLQCYFSGSVVFIISALCTSHLFLTSEALFLIFHNVAFYSVCLLLYISRLLARFYIWVELVDVLEHCGLVWLAWLLVLWWWIKFPVAMYPSCFILWIRICCLFWCNFLCFFFFFPLGSLCFLFICLLRQFNCLSRAGSYIACSHSCEGFRSPCLTQNLELCFIVWIWDV